LAELEQGLIKFTIDQLEKFGFEMISVPDILYPRVIESCGMAVRGDRNQVYFVETGGEDACLSGTAEMAIGGFLQNRVFSLEELPLKLAAVSRCFRAETSSLEEEAGLYRVHYFTKVEMFGVTGSESGTESNDLHEEFLFIQKQLFQKFNLHYRVLEMPPSELGLSAHRKFDIEAWLPGKKMFGEISSCSNCTDFQSRRLDVRYKSGDGQVKFVHTVNGTACAVPRMLISLVETFQTPGGGVELPPRIQECMVRSWDESAAQNPNVEFNFLRTKTQQDRVTSEFL
jgi:seryl-tRNA synthetase